MSLTVTQFASLGGKARWKGKSKKDRSIAMKKVRASAIHKQAQNKLDEQARQV